MSYKQTAKELGIKFRIGKYGVQFGRGLTPNNFRYGWKIIRIVPLDGWILDNKEVVRHIRENGLEL